MGLEVELTALLSVASNFLHPDIHTLAIALLAKPIGGVASAGDDVDELGWFSLSKASCQPLPLRPIATWLSATSRRGSQVRRLISPMQADVKLALLLLPTQAFRVQ